MAKITAKGELIQRDSRSYETSKGKQIEATISIKTGENNGYPQITNFSTNKEYFIEKIKNFKEGEKIYAEGYLSCFCGKSKETGKKYQITKVNLVTLYLQSENTEEKATQMSESKTEQELTDLPF